MSDEQNGANQALNAQLVNANNPAFNGAGGLYQGLAGLGFGYQPPTPPSFDEAIRVAKARLAQIEQQLSCVDALKKEATKLRKLLAGAE